MLENKIGLITITRFREDTAELVQQALGDLQQARALIVDVRDNPGGSVDAAIETISLFLVQGRIVEIKFRQGGKMIEEALVLRPDKLKRPRISGNPHAVSSYGIPTYERKFRQLARQPLVILTNGHTASAAEMFVAALQQNNRAYIIGERTYGKGIGQILYSGTFGPCRYLLRITCLHYYTPNHTWLGNAQNIRNGITPDRVVKVSGSGSDSQVVAALDYLRNAVSAGGSVHRLP